MAQAEQRRSKGKPTFAGAAWKSRLKSGDSSEGKGGEWQPAGKHDGHGTAGTVGTGGDSKAGGS